MTREEKLIIGLKNGSYTAFNEIYDLYAKRLYAFCLKYLKNEQDTEELVQDVFIRLWHSRESIRQEQTLRPLLFVMSRRRLINAYRAGMARPRHEEVGLCAGMAQPDDDRLEYEELLSQLHRHIDRLPATQRQVVEMAKLQQMTNKEIAQQLNLSEQTVKNQLSLGMKTIRGKLGKTTGLLLLLLFVN